MKEAGRRYEEGDGVEANVIKALEYYSRIKSKYVLTTCDYSRIGNIEEEMHNYKNAADWYKRIIEEGPEHVSAPKYSWLGLASLSALYHEGKGVEKDFGMSVKTAILAHRYTFADYARLNKLEKNLFVSSDDFQNYYHSRFRYDFKKYFHPETDIKTGISIVQDCGNHERGDADPNVEDMFKSSVHFFYFATAVMYTLVFTKVFINLYGKEASNELLRATGWSEIRYDGADKNSVTYMMMRCRFMPVEYSVLLQALIIELTKDDMLDLFTDFLKYGIGAVDKEAADRVGGYAASDTADIRHECMEMIREYREFIQEPVSLKDHMDFEY